MTEKNPDKTRKKLLESAFFEIYRVGFQAANIDRILKSAGVTKGALYHHFSGKKELGYAVVDEVIGHWIADKWSASLKAEGNAIEVLKGTVTAAARMLRGHDENGEVGHCAEMAEVGDVTLGCPLMNLAQEMSPVDEGFRLRIERIFDSWHAALAEVLERGVQDGTLRSNVDPRKTARFLIAMYEGAIGIAKNSKSVEAIYESLEMMGEFIDTLAKPAEKAA